MCIKHAFAAALMVVLSTAAVSQTGCQQSRLSLAPPYPNAENRRSDTFDILKYTISLEIGSTSSPTVGGNTVVRFTPKIGNRTYIRLDLLKMVIDSVRENSTVLFYAYNDTVLRVNFSAPKNIGDTAAVRIYYHGPPQIDASGWGGFYFDNTQNAQYAYNLGVGFAAKPHNYGRVWYPCFDNFVERAAYVFNITNDSTRRAYCNGQLTSDALNGAKRTRTWVLNDQIPSYLASVSVADYRQVNMTVNTLTGVKPIIIAAHATDTTPVKTGFANLPFCVQAFESFYGPYKWNRVGYCLVPFGSGAMEHATNITYPRAAAGSQSFEDLMSHEFSHHWWGDLVTCETPEDMWINEGWASFSAFLFYDLKYGKAAYLSRVKNQHESLLHFLHKTEGGFRAVSGVPHDLTYGDHVYKKGSDVIHTLRGYLGDSLFKLACKHVMAQNSFQKINSNELRDLMQAGSGANLADFFNDWIFNGGWSHFAIDSVTYVPNGMGGVTAVVSTRQKTYGAPAYHSNVPLELTFFKPNWSRDVKRVTLPGQAAVFYIALPYQPVYCALNFDSKIGDATSHEYVTVKTAGQLNFLLGKANLNVQNVGSDSSLVRLIHNYVRPDDFRVNTQGHRLSKEHYWKLEGIFSPGFIATLRINYDGNKTLSGANAYLDTSLTHVNGDSIGVFYRPDARTDWQWLRYAKKYKTGQRTGFFDIDSARAGEYAFGNLGDTLTIGIPRHDERPFARLYPNPASNKCRVEILEPAAATCRLQVIGGDGKVLFSRKITGTSEMDLSSFARGTYTVQVISQDTVLFAQKLVVE